MSHVLVRYTQLPSVTPYVHASLSTRAFCGLLKWRPRAFVFAVAVLWLTDSHGEMGESRPITVQLHGSQHQGVCAVRVVRRYLVYRLATRAGRGAPVESGCTIWRQLCGAGGAAGWGGGGGGRGGGGQDDVVDLPH